MLNSLVLVMFPTCCVSFSSNDAIGHCWGPDSQEVLDVTLRSDLIMKELLDYLDAKVGKGRYVLALTADHGVCPMPEVTVRQGNVAARVSPSLLRTERRFPQRGNRLTH
jgi:predicted AlkP superfamily pyrophosphatase or phosphodiesterase